MEKESARIIWLNSKPHSARKLKRIVTTGPKKQDKGSCNDSAC